MRKNNKRADILEAALKVVDEAGANHLTIDAVAARSGFSKGGVLYHFASKKALLDGMLNYLIDTNHQRIEASRDKSKGTSPLAALLHVDKRMTATERRASLALLAASAEDAELMAPAREHLKALFQQVTEESADPMEAVTLFLASEGLRFLDILELNPMNREETEKVLSHLNQRAEAL